MSHIHQKQSPLQNCPEPYSIPVDNKEETFEGKLLCSTEGMPALTDSVGTAVHRPPSGVHVLPVVLRAGRRRHCGRGKSTPPGAVIGAVVKSAMLEAIACSVRKLMRQEAWPLVQKRPSLLEKDMNSSLLDALVTNRALNKAQRAGQKTNERARLFFKNFNVF